MYILACRPTCTTHTLCTVTAYVFTYLQTGPDTYVHNLNICNIYMQHTYIPRLLWRLIRRTPSLLVGLDASTVKGSANGKPPCWPGIWVYAGYSTLPPYPERIV